jgi:DNA repair exonuclease SbcCD nuclease subunit
MLHVFHTADLHIGKNRKYHDYLHQQRLMLWGILGRLREFVEAHVQDEIWVVIAGDVFDRNEDTTREEFYLFLDFLSDLSISTAHQNVHTYIIDGNHDRQPDADCPSVLTPLMNFAPENVTMAVVKPLFIADKQLLLIPFGGYQEADYRGLIQRFKPRFVVGHECLQNIVTDKGYSTRNQEKYIDITNVDQDVLAIFMGDIHNCQQVGKAWYCGTPTTLEHGDKLPKGVLVHSFGEDISRELVSLGTPKLRVHQQIGRVFDESKVEDVVGELRQFEDKYVQIVVTPETYALIDKEVPGFFQSSQVSWEFKHEEVVAKPDDTEATVSDDIKAYYRPLIDQWVQESLINLVADERDECLSRLYEIFDKRG